MSRAQLSERMSRYRRRLRSGFPPVVSEGDSWFDYPLFLNLIDRIDDEGLFAHLRLEQSGDTVAAMIAEPSDLRSLRDIVAEEQPLCLFFSGGGNDLAAAADTLFVTGPFEDPADYIAAEPLDELLDMLGRAYRRMVAEVGPITPVFAHGYDYFPPSEIGVNFMVIRNLTGPWIHPGMVAANILDGTTQRAIARVLVDQFNEMLAEIASENPLDFVHVDLRGVLDIEKDWVNEIHPTRRGFQKVASAFLDTIRTRLPELEADRLRRRLGP